MKQLAGLLFLLAPAIAAVIITFPDFGWGILFLLEFMVFSVVCFYTAAILLFDDK